MCLFLVSAFVCPVRICTLFAGNNRCSVSPFPLSASILVCRYALHACVCVCVCAVCLLGAITQVAAQCDHWIA